MVWQIPKNSGKLYYQFIENGKRYNGACKGRTAKRAAEKYEREIRETILKASSQKTISNNSLSSCQFEFVSQILFRYDLFPVRKLSWTTCQHQL